MSTTGVFFETEKVHSVGASIEFSMDIGDVTVECDGRVVRVERLEGKFGVAVELTSYAFD